MVLEIFRINLNMNCTFAGKKLGEMFVYCLVLIIYNISGPSGFIIK